MFICSKWFFHIFDSILYSFFHHTYSYKYDTLEKATKETKINGQKDTAKWNPEVLIPRFLDEMNAIFSIQQISDYQKNHSTVLSR